MGKFRTAQTLLTVAVLIAAANVHGAAATPQWKAAPYQYVIVDQELRAVLTEFGRNLNIPLKVSASLKGQRVRGTMPAKFDWTAETFLRNLTDTYSLVWFHDGNALHIAERNEMGTELISLDRKRSKEIEQYFSKLDVSQPEINVRVVNDGKAVAVTGPDSYRAFVRGTVSALVKQTRSNARESAMTDHSDVRVFRGGS